MLEVTTIGPVGTCVTEGSTNVSATIGNTSSQVTVTVNPPPTVTSVTVTPSPASCAPLGSVTFDAVAHFSDGTMQDVSILAMWTSDTPVVATVVGPLAACLAPGNSNISASYGGKTGSSMLTVTAPPTVTSVTVTPSPASCLPLGSVTFDAVAHFSDGTMQDVSTNLGTLWTSSQPLVATVVGPIAACLASGNSTITAAYGGKSGSSTLTVPAETSVVVTPNPASCTLLGSVTLTATAHFSDSSTLDVSNNLLTTWQSGNTLIVTELGPVATCVLNGSVSVSATYGGFTGSTTVNVGTPTSITITPASPNVVENQTLQLTAMANYATGPSVNVTNSATWATLFCVFGGSVSSTGLFTAGALPGAPCTVTATLGLIVGSDSITTVAPPPTLLSITVGPLIAMEFGGEPLQMTATGNYSDGSMAVITNSVTWAVTSCSNATGSITATGLFIGESGLLTGSCGVSATSGAIVGTTTVSVEL